MELSIIIPVFNDLNAIKKTINALNNQTYDRDKFEIIVVDNNSSDGSYEYLQTVDNIVLLRETINLGSPYSCRNRGIEASKADLIAFLDSTCVPKENFVEKGIEFSKNNKCDLFGGEIIFDFEGHQTASKVYDSITNIQMKKNIEEDGVAKTANLWVNRYVIEEVGTFLEGVRSGDDIGFTNRCKDKGMKLIFCEDCVAYKFARGFKELMKKQYRVGKGKAKLWYSQGLRRMMNNSWKLLMPILPNKFKKLLSANKRVKYNPWLVMKIYLVSYFCKQATFWGITKEAQNLKKVVLKRINIEDREDLPNINDIIPVIAEKHLLEINRQGSIAGGHNGPYYDIETSVRNTAHYAALFSYMYKITGDKKYYNGVKQCGDYLASNDSRPNNANFFCRQSTKKDMCNGTIGAAWAIEGLVESYKVVKDEKYINIAQEVFRLFPYDAAKNAWIIIDTDGAEKTIDITFNHQLWLAAAGIEILSVCQNTNIKESCDAFLYNIEKIFKTYSNGLIKHTMYTSSDLKEKIINIARRGIYLLRMIRTGQSMKYKENGYHLFNIYAFAIIKDLGWEIPLFKTKKFKTALNYCFSDELYDWLEARSVHYDINRMTKVKNKEINIYGYPYNAPGFEIPYIYKVFKDNINASKDFVDNIIKKQMILTFDKDKMTFSKSCEDNIILDARIYEYVRSLT